MTTQPEALRLAAELEACPSINYKTHAAELRRLHAERTAADGVINDLVAKVRGLQTQRDALLEALKQIEPILARMYGPQAAELPPMQIVRAAIAKTEGQQ